jgi:hypothetical protein
VKIATDWPLPKQLIENEVATLERMGNNPGLRQSQQQLWNDAQRRHQHYKYQANKRTEFSFGSWLVFPESPNVSKAAIECLLIADTKKPGVYNMVTYSFALCSRHSGACKNRLIKKFHIDFTPTPNTDRPPLHPVFHLQSPGKLSPMLRKYGLKDNHLEPGLSEPRLCSAPTTIALLTDFLLREFGGNHTSPLTKLTENSEWQSLIRKNEELVLKPYYDACNGFFRNRESRKDPERHQLFSQDFVYGKP